MRAFEPTSRSRRWWWMPCVAMLASLSACGEKEPTATAGAASAPTSSSAPAGTPRSAAAAGAGARLTITPSDGTCQATGAHAAHAAKGITCVACHPCGGGYGFTNVVTFPGGTSSANGTINLNGPSTTCSVACHSPLGATPQSVAWNAGPLACTTCHNNVGTSANMASSHFAGISNPAAACQLCHDVSQHTQGQVFLFNSDGTSAPATCTGCHSGQGQTLAGNTPPLLVGWTDAVNGDFHGARAGTGLGGGTLAPPFYQGYPAIDCRSCHDAHSSGNAFLFAPTVNGATVPAGAITRAGVGAEVLCAGCHEGDHHALCKQCHTAKMKLDSSGVLVFDPASGPADPEPPGSPCFLCHGHEGIVNWPAPGSYDNMTGDMTNDPSCYHCHNYRQLVNPNKGPIIQQGRLSGGGMSPPPAWFPNPPLLLAPAGNVFNVASTSASIWWETDRSATTFVEWGTSAPGFVAGFPTTPTSVLAYPFELFPPPYQAQTYHRVDLTGLAPNTTYQWRIRTVDQFRSVTTTAVQTFTTTAANAPPAPTTLVQEPMQYNANPDALPSVTFPISPPLTWNAVSYQGHALQYRVVVASDAGFTKIAADSGFIAATSYGNVNVTAKMSVQNVRYYWRVMTLDTVSGVQSAWSATSSFQVFVDDPYSY